MLDFTKHVTNTETSERKDLPLSHQRTRQSKTQRVTEKSMAREVGGGGGGIKLFR